MFFNRLQIISYSRTGLGSCRSDLQCFGNCLLYKLVENNRINLPVL
jgi:hypothetical protein